MAIEWNRIHCFTLYCTVWVRLCHGTLDDISYFTLWWFNSCYGKSLLFGVQLSGNGPGPCSIAMFHSNVELSTDARGAQDLNYPGVNWLLVTWDKPDMTVVLWTFGTIFGSISLICFSNIFPYTWEKPMLIPFFLVYPHEAPWMDWKSAFSHSQMKG